MNDFSLYWWRPSGKGQSNLGDEISPIVLSHVSGRRIIRAGLDDCEGIAIGSVFYPRKASARKRSKPLFVWGSGTLKPRPCSYQGLSVILAALRGPRTASQIENCPDVPFGDPGLFVREIWPKQEPSTGRVGIIPHHGLRRHPATTRLSEALENSLMIDFTSADLSGPLQTLSSCQFIVSSSLHGLIIADAYGIPSVFWNELGEENEWKFLDYFEGVGRQDYVALTAEQIVEAAAHGEIRNLPFSLLSESHCDRVVEDLRAASRLMP